MNSGGEASPVDAEPPEALGGAASDPAGGPICGQPFSLWRAAQVSGTRALVGAAFAALAAGIYSARSDSSDLAHALLFGACCGGLPLFLPSLVELRLRAWTRPRLVPSALALYGASLLSWLLSLGQVLYLYALSRGAAPAEAPAEALALASASPGPLIALQLVPPLALTLASLLTLGWIRRRARTCGSVGLSALALVLLLGWRVDRDPSWLLASAGLFVLAALTLVAFLFNALGESLVQASPPPAERPAEPPRPPPGPLTWGERIALGGDSQMFASLVGWGTLAGLAALLELGRGPVAACGCLWVAHSLVAANTPGFLLALGRPERALAVARYLLHGRANSRLPGMQRGLRIFREVEVRALLALGRTEEAEGFLPGVELEGSGFLVQATRYRLAKAYLAAGIPAQALGLLAGIPAEGAALGPGARALEDAARRLLDPPGDPPDEPPDAARDAAPAE